MKITKTVKKILSNYSSESPALRKNLAHILGSGKLGGTGKLVILPVDQGFEHGPDRSFAKNPFGYDPNYHVDFAIKAGLNGFAAPLGMLELVVDRYVGEIPLILKINSANSLTSDNISPTQANTSSVSDAVRLGCAAIGLTIYPGSDSFTESIYEAQQLIAEAKSAGLAVIIWSYPRGEGIDKSHETALDVIAYAAHIATMIGANIVKVKPPENKFSDKKALDAICDNAGEWLAGIIHNTPILAGKKTSESDILKLTSSLSTRIAHIKRCCFKGQRLVIFSGGIAKSEPEILEEIQQIKLGGGDGSIIGRNAFQRNQHEALDLLSKITNVYLRG